MKRAATRARHPRWSLALLLPLLAGLLSSCLNVPTSGPLEAGPGSSQEPSGPVEIQPEPPAPDAPASLVVEGFLHAMANFRTDYSVAREYLAADVRDTWQPDEAVLVYGEGSPLGADGSVVLEAPLVGVVGADGGYSHEDLSYRIDFEMERDEAGQWRIGNPPAGLLISQYLFERFYDGLNVYFFDPGFATLVPDPIYVPRGNQSATTLVEALLSGPTRWLEPAVVSALPEQTELGLSIPISPEGVAEVSLDDALTPLTAEQRNRMAAQVIWTLRQITQVSSVRFLVDGAPYVVPDQSPNGTVPITAYDYLAPIPDTLGPDLYVADEQGIGRYRDRPGSGAVTPLDGPFGSLAEPVDSMAVAPAPDPQVAVVDQDGSRVRVADGSAEVETVMEGRSDLLTPQYSRFHDLWLLDRVEDGSELYVLTDGELAEVDAPALESSTVRSFRISPDGSRMAILRQVGDRTELGMALVRRGETPSVDSWRAVPLVSASGRKLEQIQSVGWADDTSLILIGGTDAESQLLPWVVDQDGAELTQVGAAGWTPVSLHTSPNAVAPSAAVVGEDGELWVRQGDYRWPQVLSGISTAAYPG